jgi:hypothetical protein
MPYFTAEDVCLLLLNFHCVPTERNNGGFLKTAALILSFFLVGASLFAQQRTVRELFPSLNEKQYIDAFSEDGTTRSGKGNEGLLFMPQTGGNPNILSRVSGKNLSFIVESMRVVPKRTNLLSVYNALGKIRGLKGKTYHSATRDKVVALFEDATRIESPKKTTAINDPPPSSYVPALQTIYIRLKDNNFGNCFYTLSFETTQRGILCAMTNFKTISYGIFPVMKEERFIALLYIEPSSEGLVVYSVTGAEVSDFMAKQINMTSALRKRLDVIIDWMIDGIEGI